MMMKEKMKKYGKWMIFILIAVLAGGGGYYWYTKSQKEKAPAEFQTVRVELGNIQSQVSATGTIKPVDSVDVSSKITGLIEKVYVSENDKVQAGQILMKLDDRHLTAQLKQAKAKLDNAAMNYRRMQTLADSGAIAVQQLDSSRMDYNVAQAAYDDAVSQLDDSIIRAPLDGLVIGKPIPAGQTVSPGISTPMVLLTVANMSKLQIDTQVDESDIGKVKVGQRATFTVDAYPGKQFSGVVSNVSKKATTQQNVVYYSVLIDIDTVPEDLLRPTMTARVSVLVGERQNVVIIPLRALKDAGNRQTVQVMRNGQAETVPVKTGMANEDSVEILQGLEAGMEIQLPKTQGAKTNGAGPRIFGR